jgi:sigma-B regulation protein RsbU (phosphoserine phosphatase)
VPPDPCPLGTALLGGCSRRYGVDEAPSCESLISNGRKVVERQYVGTGDRSLEQLDVIRRCVGALQERAGGSSLWEQELLARAFAELRAALHALSMTQEELARRSEIARTLQESLLPPDLPSIPGIELAAWYQPAEQEAAVGGDFYDLFEADDGAWGLLIGDVSGKGIAAATVTALVRHTARAAARTEHRPGQILRALNDALLRQRSREVVCTALYGRLEPIGAGARLTVASGGHPCPLLARAEGSVATVGQPGVLLGISPRPEGTDHVLDLQPGDTLVFYTDGVTEAGAPDELFGEERLARLVGTCAGLDPAGLVTRIQRAVMEFQEGSPRDDIAVVVLRVSGSTKREARSAKQGCWPDG